MLYFQLKLIINDIIRKLMNGEILIKYLKFHFLNKYEKETKKLLYLHEYTKELTSTFDF